MNRFSALQPDEEILRQERLHPGIFALPVLLLILLLLPTIPILSVFNTMVNIIGQLSSPSPRPTLSIVWLLLISVEILPAFLVFMLVLVAYLNSQVILTNKRLIYRTGFVVRAEGELPLENVDAMFILEPLLGRLFGYGTVTVSSLGGLRLPFQYLGKPHVFHAALQSAVSAVKNVSRSTPKLPPAAQDDPRYMSTPH